MQARVAYVLIALWGTGIYLLPLRTLLIASHGMRMLLAVLVLGMPVLFAGMVFIRSFAQARFSGTALGWNLLGAVMGGMLETSSQAFGMRFLMLLAMALYMGSWLALSRADTMKTASLQAAGA